MRFLEEFYVMGMNAMSHHSGGVMLFYKNSWNFKVEALQLRGPNIVSFQMAMGGHQWHVVGCYIALHDVSTMDRIVEDIHQCPWGAKLLVSRELNDDMVASYGQERDETTAVALDMEVLEDIAEYFLSCHYH